MSTAWGTGATPATGKSIALAIVQKYLVIRQITQARFRGLKARLTPPPQLPRATNAYEIASPRVHRRSYVAGPGMFALHLLTAAKDYHASVAFVAIPARLRGAETPVGTGTWFQTPAKKRPRPRETVKPQADSGYRGRAPVQTIPPRIREIANSIDGTGTSLTQRVDLRTRQECAPAALIGRTTFQQAAIRHSGYSETRRADVAARS